MKKTRWVTKPIKFSDDGGLYFGSKAEGCFIAKNMLRRYIRKNVIKCGSCKKTYTKNKNCRQCKAYKLRQVAETL